MKTENKKVPSTKGDLSTVFYYPERQTGRLAILCPGFLDSKDYKGLAGLAEELSKKGYTVVRFDPTGTWESEGDISDYTMTQYLEDIRSVLEYALKKNPYSKILVGGHSRGGQLSILYAARDPRISLVLGIMPSSGPITGQQREEWEKAGVSISQRDLPDNKDENREFRVPFSHVLDRDMYDVAGDAKKIKAPIVLIAGESDELVAPEDVKEIYDNANEPKKFITIAGIGHNYRFSDEEVKMVNEKILEQLSEYL